MVTTTYPAADPSIHASDLIRKGVPPYIPTHDLRSDILEVGVVSACSFDELDPLLGAHVVLLRRVEAHHSRHLALARERARARGSGSGCVRVREMGGRMHVLVVRRSSARRGRCHHAQRVQTANYYYLAMLCRDELEHCDVAIVDRVERPRKEHVLLPFSPVLVRLPYQVQTLLERIDLDDMRSSNPPGHEANQVQHQERGSREEAPQHGGRRVLLIRWRRQEFPQVHEHFAGPFWSVCSVPRSLAHESTDGGSWREGGARCTARACVRADGAEARWRGGSTVALYTYGAYSGVSAGSILIAR